MSKRSAKIGSSEWRRLDELTAILCQPEGVRAEVRSGRARARSVPRAARFAQLNFYGLVLPLVPPVLPPELPPMLPPEPVGPELSLAAAFW